LEIKGLKKTYDHGFEALKGTDLKVKKGDLFALPGADCPAKPTTDLPPGHSIAYIHW